VHVRTVFPAASAGDTTFLYSESGQGDEGRSLFFVLQHATHAERLARELISLFKSTDVWESARAFAWEVRMRTERTEIESSEPVQLSLALVYPPETIVVARGEGILGYDDGVGLAFSAPMADGVPRLLARPHRDGWFVRSSRPNIGEYFVLGFRGDLIERDAQELSALPRLLERSPRPSPTDETARALSERGGALIVGRFNHLPKPEPEPVEPPPDTRRSVWSAVRDRSLAVLALTAALATFVHLQARTKEVSAPAVVRADEGGADVSWVCSLRSPAEFHPLAIGNSLFVPCDDGSVRVVEASSGSVVRSMKAAVSPASDPILAAGRFLLGGEGGELAALDPISGATQWRRDLGEPVRVMRADRDRVWAAVGGNLLAIEAETGKTVWKRRLTESPIGSLEIASGVGVVTGEDGTIVAFHPWSAKERWRIHVAPGRTPVFLHKGTLYVAASDGVLHAVSLSRGRTRWTRDLGVPFAGGVSGDGEQVYSTTRDGWVVAIETSDGDVAWRKPLGGTPMAPPIVDGDRLICITADGILRSYDCTDGGGLETRRTQTPTAGVMLLHGPRVITVTANGDLEAVGRGFFEST